MWRLRHGVRFIIRAGCFTALLWGVLSSLGGCESAGTKRTPLHGLLEQLKPVAAQTVPQVGAGQGLAIHNNFVYLYGDADPGVVIEFTFVPDPEPMLKMTGRTVALTLSDEDVIPHPTGLTFHDEYGCFLGDTVRQLGVIWHLDWSQALDDGTLDRAVRNRAVDDLAINGTRPEFIRMHDSWWLATADYGTDRNAVRLYDPVRLATASRTSADGVLQQTLPAGSLVQTLYFDRSSETLVKVQNQVPGLGYRLTPVAIDPGLSTGSITPVEFAPVDYTVPTDELEGWAPLADVPGGEGWFISLSAMSVDNVRFWRVAQ